MKRAAEPAEASLEALVEHLDLGLESLHPGGLALTFELAERCGIEASSKVLDVASGTGEGACALAAKFSCSMTGLDHSARMVERARKKAEQTGIAAEFVQGDAQQLPFHDAAFDVVLCECTLCFFDKARALQEMRRVLRPGGWVGMHDLCWADNTPDGMKRSLLELEKESPETFDGWKQRFEQAGFVQVSAFDRSAVFRSGVAEISRRVGLSGHLQLFGQIVARWGLRGLIRILRSELLLRNPRLGYAMVVGRNE